MVKLTPELINASMQYINPCRDRELDLRGYKIPQIENMGATLDQFDTIDFSDNDLRRLDGFPYLPRIKCLLLNNNRIVRIADNLHEFLPNLESLILTGNNIQDFSDLDALLSLTKLETLSLLTNPITTDAHYREYVAYKFPKLRLLDFRKIRQKDRQAAVELFRSKKGKELLKEIAKKAKAAAENPSADANNSKVSTTSAEDVQRIRDAIKNATSLHEVERLTRILQSGNIPENLNAENGNGTSHDEHAMEM
ncbi:probable U2 small nuclear ribonucleoprotein A' [Contarinia nasturtii]|uniref:probable U2 small nuclear ribonucleoprotein A' n=1 Tax=Contarinia nasturtii TaxID=265458 RepID=UPI0012D42613|nr:probable U2 small nuclear ribonucleoprotein A' [Contarinia nasturtii]